MKEGMKVDGRELHEADAAKRKDRRDRDAMSPSMRELILNFVEGESERIWDPTVFARSKDVAGPATP
jgi:hypothetical protein